jgi:elongation factor P
LTVWNGNVVDVQLPLQSKCAVVELTRNGGQNIAKLENGMDVNVPSFVRVGDVIVVTTEDGKYVSRE